MEDIKSTLQKLKPFIGKKADALWIRYHTGDRLEKQEWEQVINLLAEKHQITSIEENIVLPHPKERDCKATYLSGAPNTSTTPPPNSASTFPN